MTNKTRRARVRVERVDYEREVAALQRPQLSMDANVDWLRSLPQSKSWMKLYSTLRELEGHHLTRNTPAGRFTMILSSLVGDSVSASSEEAVIDQLMSLVGSLNAEAAKATKARKAKANEDAVSLAYHRLQPSQQGAAAAALISKSTKLSKVTVRKYLTALNIRQKGK